jgi:hypothetical protein
MLEGCDNSIIASLIGMTERTVRRYLADFRNLYAMDPSDKELGPRMLGELQKLAYTSINRLADIVNDTTIPAPHRIAAENAIHRHYTNVIDTARKLGYLNDGRLLGPEDFDDDDGEDGPDDD